MRRAAITTLLASAVAAVAATTLATAQSQSPYTLPEPKVTSAQVLKLSSRATGSCSRRRVSISVLTPPGLGYSRLQIRVGNSTLTTMTGVIGAVRSSVALPTSRARVTVSARTKSGVALSAGRTYPRCARPRRPTRPSRPSNPSTPVVEEGRNPPPVIFEGGGED